MIQASNAHIDIIKDYQRNIEVHEVIIGKLERRKKALAFTRLTTVLGGAWFCMVFLACCRICFFRHSLVFYHFYYSRFR